MTRVLFEAELLDLEDTGAAEPWVAARERAFIAEAVEFDGTNVFITNNSTTPTRKTVAFTDSTITSGQIANGTITSAMIASGAVGSTQLASGLTLGGTTSGTFSGSGAALTALNATQLTTGTVADARLNGAGREGRAPGADEDAGLLETREISPDLAPRGQRSRGPRPADR